MLDDDTVYKLFGYGICIIASFIFTIIVISDYGTKHVQMPWYKVILLFICIFLLSVLVTCSIMKRYILH